ncbi:hypothetical protein DENIS_3830 [Desulfonema ishimotonii]|uniref:Cysteine dioxygenase n=1 Tax=Desulfonema ishimotonii TaxID=45657 RepID=A0A401G0Y0_9BACT|nr:hypothetical protein DENIS_3830 [Desulfonema ishimotonii]
MISEAPSELLAYCEQWNEDMAGFESEAGQIEYIRETLPDLLSDHSLVRQILEKIAGGGAYPDVRRCGAFQNELLLYLSPEQRFSLRLYFHEPGRYTVIHDHSSWGISGTPRGELGVIRYRREDDGKRPGYARLSECGRRILSPGEVDVTLPLDRGIHQTGSPEHRISVMLSVYGRPVRRLYFNQFDPENNRVHRVWPPRMKKKMLAGQALKEM